LRASGETTAVDGADTAFFERALAVAAEADARAYPKPTVGAVVAADGEVVAEAATEAGRTGRHAESAALEAAGERARGATLHVTLEPCAHTGSTPPCVDAVLEAGVARVVAGQLDPNPKVEGGGLEKLRAAGVEVELADGDLSFRARQQLEEWRTWVAKSRPFVTFKVAITLDGRVTVPGERWVTGEASRRLVHLLRASSDAVAVGMGTVRSDDPRLDARDVPTPRGQPRRLAFGRGPLPEGSELELRSGPLGDELEALAADGVQSLLLEGGPTLAAAFLEQDLVDKLLVFVAPKVSGEGPGMLESLSAKRDVVHAGARAVGEDVLLQAYLREP
jgi:diaminohydroxyphosphoribosylaminopyrimidine deaminase / 5-amino-6-(5-phosphoribosylamino)uracil reductase